MRRSIASAVIATLATLVVAFGASAQAATPYGSNRAADYAQRLLTLVNKARANHGLHALKLASGTAYVANTWSHHMATHQTLSHDPSLRTRLENNGSANWNLYGENVGYGMSSSPGALFRSYMQSPEHRANILKKGYRYIGIAVVFSDGGLAWNTMDFVDAYNG